MNALDILFYVLLSAFVTIAAIGVFTPYDK